MNNSKPNYSNQSESKSIITAVGTASLVMIVFLLLMGCSGESSSSEDASKPSAVTPVTRRTIVAMGDSLTAGLGVDERMAYPAQLQRKLAGDGYNFDVVNAGISGETSSGALSRIKWVISALKPEIIILETGANDGIRGIDPDILEKNLDRIISVIKANNIDMLLCGMKMFPNVGPEYSKAFAGVYAKIAETHAVPLIPFFLEGVAGNPQFNQPDGIHPTAKGYSRIVDHIYPYVLDVIK